MKKLLIFSSVFIAAYFACQSSKTKSVKNKEPFNHNIPLKRILDSLHLASKKLEIIIHKSDYELSIANNGKILKTYPVVFGGNPVDDKLKEGDGCTPEGVFHIRNKYPHKSWSYFMWVDFPTKESLAKHNKAKKEGKLKPDDTIGGEVGIHGVPKGTDAMIKTRYNWTLGCISLTNEDITEVYNNITVGAKVSIYH
ncbi:MAG: L,D-transpeptidase [Bacteroidetes bacterium]|nr:L,D-transpeptidase [Bacteroidota bacterium]